jgi:transposase
LSSGLEARAPREFCLKIKAVREAIRRHIDGHPGLKQRAGLLVSIPGVGTATAAWLLTFLSEHRGFDDPKQAAAFSGLGPRLRQSGQWVRQTRLSKTGDPMPRKALYMPMLSALSFNPAIRAFCQRLRSCLKTKWLICMIVESASSRFEPAGSRFPP